MSDVPDFYKPYQKDIYIINSLIPKEYVFAAYNYRNRCYNFNYISRKKRRFNSKTLEISNLPSFLKEHSQEIERYIDDYLGKNEKIKRAFEHFKSTTSISHEDAIVLHYYLLEIYNSFPVSPRRYLDGILRAVIQECSKLQHKSDDAKVKFNKGDSRTSDCRLKYAEIDQINSQEEFVEFPPVQMKFYGTDDESDDHHSSEKSILHKLISTFFPKPVFTNRRKHKLLLLKNRRFLETLEVSQDKEYQDFNFQSEINADSDSSKNEFFFNYLWFFWNFEASTGNSYLDEEERKKFLKLMSASYVVPVYSASLPAGDYGTIAGHLYCPFETAKSRADNYNQVAKMWDTWAPLIAQSLLKSREEALLSQPITIGYSDDILKDLLSKVTFVQDWEKAAVFKPNAEGKYEPRYCFRRYPGKISNGHQRYEELWDICKPETEKCEAGCYICYLEVQNKNSGKIIDGKCFYWWPIREILDPLVMPSVDHEDIERYKNHVVCFEFPECTFFPRRNDKEAKITQEEGVTAVGGYYINKLIPIFDKLLLKRRVLQHSTKAAVSAIFARNHSHHIGSHVTPRTTVNKIMERLKTLRGITRSDDQINAIGFMREQLDEYIQRKADFGAEIATEPIISTSTKRLYGEILLPFIQNSLLMDNIGANENIHYVQREARRPGVHENRLKIRVFHGDTEITFLLSGGSNCQCKSKRKWNQTNIPYGTFCDCGSNVPLMIEKGLEHDLSVALPGPLGEFALYCFLENFIRNSIKHNYDPSREDGDWIINLRIQDYDNDFYYLGVWDDVSKPDKKISTEDEKEESLVHLISGLIDEHIIDSEGRLRKGAWGIAEMKIMATLLAGSSDFLRMEDDYLKVTTEKIGDDKKLVYAFRIMKPREVAIISSSIPENALDHEKKGVFWFDSVDKYVGNVDRGKSPAGFNFLVFLKQLTYEEFKGFGHLFPFRTMTLPENGPTDVRIPGSMELSTGIMKDWKDSSAESIVAACWKEWVGSLKNESLGIEDEDVCLGLYLQQNANEKPTEDFIVVANEMKEKNLPVHFSVVTGDGEIKPELPTDLKHLLLYDRHFAAWGSISKWVHKTGNKSLKIRDLVHFHEGFDKTSADFVPIFSGHATKEKVFELAEAALLKILVLDERVAEVSKDLMLSGDSATLRYGTDGNSRIMVAKAANVFIATHLKINGECAVPVHRSIEDILPRICVECKVEGSTVLEFTPYWCKSKDCSECIDRERLPVNVLILHQGVAETQLKQVILPEGKSDFRKAFEVFLRNVRERIPYVVVDSGRGIPSNLPNNVKFLPFSKIEEYVMKDRMAKLGLATGIMSLIRRGK